jgi:catechol 2,3-dioxygenase-like lactoylglutathione lyase family enzyme
MASLDHIILKVNDLNASVSFYTEVLGFPLEGVDRPFTVLRAGPDCQLQLAPWGTPGLEHYAFSVSKRGIAPTLYFNDPNKHLLEIRTYER